MLGIRGEPATPNDPAQGFVWQAIVRQIDDPGSVSEWMSAADSQRTNFKRHPWSIGGGGAAELKMLLEDGCVVTLAEVSDQIGVSGASGEDELYLLPDEPTKKRLRLEQSRSLILGDGIRDWSASESLPTLWPYDDNFKVLPLSAVPEMLKLFWLARTVIIRRKPFGIPIVQRGMAWYEWQELYTSKLKTPLSILFAEVATHNHFALDSGGKVFKNTVTVIKLPTADPESKYFSLLGVLNSSSGCFWLKQISHNKGSTVDNKGARQRTAAFEDFYQCSSTKIAAFPIPACQPSQLPTALVKASTALQGQAPAATLASWGGPESGDLRPWLASARDLATRQRRQLIAWQEELDWQIYEAFGLVQGAAESGPAAVSLPEGAAVDAIPPEGIELGQRAFEIVLARRMAAGEAQSTWFERHGSTPLTELPRHWPAAYRELVERRLRRIADDPAIRLIEQPEYKRRWNTESWDEQWAKAARDWLLARLEGYFFEGRRVCDLKGSFDPTSTGFAPATRPTFTTSNQLAEIAKTDAAFQAVAEQLMGGPGFSVPKLVRELVESASVPALPAQRYKPSGLLKRLDWEHVWELQRREDAIDAAEKVDAPDITDAERAARKSAAATRKKAELGDIPVPPKYGSGDFKKSVWWSLRGKLDVPKERWVFYPGAERTEDPSPVIAWAGWDHAQQASALAEYYLEAKTNFGFSPEKLKLLLAGLLELEPWLTQWHNAIDPLIGDSPANAIRGFLDAECHTLGVTPE